MMFAQMMDRYKNNETLQEVIKTMSQLLKTVVLNGHFHRPSRTRVLLDALHYRLDDDLRLDTRCIDLAVSLAVPVMQYVVTVSAPDSELAQGYHYA